jgi:hypothetical protein
MPPIYHNDQLPGIIQASEVLPPRTSFSGDYIWKATPVPIPNTVVKLPEPMVVPKVRE